MTKNDIINEVVSSLVFSLNKDQLELVKSTFIVKMHGYEIHELCTLPSTEVRDNDFIFKRFTVDMLAKVFHVKADIFTNSQGAAVLSPVELVK